MRSDFLVKTEDDVYYLIEVKTVVDTDYDPKYKVNMIMDQENDSL